MRRIELPRRTCGECRGSFDVLHLLPGARRLLCARCHRAVLERLPPARPWPGAALRAHAGRALRNWSWLFRAALRACGYLALHAWADADPLRSALLGGVMAGDLFTWSLASVVEIPFRPTSVAVEVVIYLLVLQLTGLGREIAELMDRSGPSFAMAALAAGLVKFLAWWRRFPDELHEDEGEDPTRAG